MIRLIGNILLTIFALGSILGILALKGTILQPIPPAPAYQMPAAHPVDLNEWRRANPDAAREWEACMRACNRNVPCEQQCPRPEAGGEMAQPQQQSPWRPTPRGLVEDER